MIRGVDFDVGIVDEAAFCKTSLLVDGVIPVALKERSCLWMPTTPGPPSSYFMNLIQLKTEDDLPCMPLIRMGRPCAKCMKTAEPWNCPHNVKDEPKWQNRKKRAKNLYLYKGHMTSYMREQFGVSSDETQRPIRPDYIAALRSKQPYRVRATPEVIFVAADSAFGGKCKFAIMAGYFPSPGTFVVRLLPAFTFCCCYYLPLASSFAAAAPLRAPATRRTPASRSPYTPRRFACGSAGTPRAVPPCAAATRPARA